MEPILVTQVLLTGMFFFFSSGFLPDTKKTAAVRQAKNRSPH